MTREACGRTFGLLLCLLATTRVATAGVNPGQRSGAPARSANRGMSALAAFAAVLVAAAPPAARRVAVTIDDLPTVAVVGQDLAADVAMTEKLLAAIRQSGAPAIGFVNERKLAPDGGSPDPARVALLEQWLEAGLDLGNHTYSHPDLHRIPLADFEKDVDRGDDVTRRLLAARGRGLRYFRHPFLHTGRDLPTKTNLEKFLSARGYTVAPVTHDNGEWIFAGAYARAGRRGDATAQQRIVEAYISYMNAKFAYFERESLSLFDREIPQILLIHANSLNADAFGLLAAMMAKRGYAFVTLGDALEDRAFRSPDTYTGSGGITWLHRWALTRGGPTALLPGEPQVPAFILELAGVDGE